MTITSGQRPGDGGGAGDRDRRRGRLGRDPGPFDRRRRHGARAERRLRGDASATNGTLTLGAALGGLTFTAGDGTADATMTFHGTLANINAALATASYAPTANYNGSATITFLVTDHFGGTVATGSRRRDQRHEERRRHGHGGERSRSRRARRQRRGQRGRFAVAVTGLSIGDVDAALAPDGVYEVTLAATNGTLTLTHARRPDLHGRRRHGRCHDDVPRHARGHQRRARDRKLRADGEL